MVWSRVQRDFDGNQVIREGERAGGSRTQPVRPAVGYGFLWEWEGARYADTESHRIRGSVETRFSENYRPSVYTVSLNNTVTRVGKFSRYAAKTDGMLLCGGREHVQRRPGHSSAIQSREDE